jgi:Rieske Fe-S protein
MWRGSPVFVRHRTAAEIEEAEAVPMSDLKDPETDEARVKEGHEQWLIMIANCTHLGCVPVGDRASSMAGSARATVRTTTPPAVSAKARRRRIW